MIYLASPYSHKNKAVEELRYMCTERVVARLLESGLMIYSPIVHCHHLATNHDLPRDQLFWNRYNHHMVGLADELWVLELGGWDKSVGVAGEIAEAERIDIPVKYLHHSYEAALEGEIEIAVSANV